MEHITIFVLMVTLVVVLLAENSAMKAQMPHPVVLALIAGALVLGAAYLWN